MIDFFAMYGAQLAWGTSLLLMLGLGCAKAHRSPARRHAWAECLLWSLPICAALLVVPMVRPLSPDLVRPSLAAPEGSLESETQVGGSGAFAPTAVSSRGGNVPGVPLLPAIFLVGATLVFAYQVCGALLLRRMVHGAWDVLPESGGPGARVVVTPSARRPFCLGTRARGLVVLPTFLFNPGHEDQLKAVLTHEQAHLQEGHGRARLVAAALTPLLYWNPLFWLLVAGLRADAELCADDAAATAVGKSRYVRALVNLVERQPHHLHSALPVMGALAPARPFHLRMETLMLRQEPLDPSSSPARRAVTLAVALAAVGLVNASCGTTSHGVGPVAMEPIAVPFEVLSLDGTGLGEALASGSETDAPFPGRVEALDGKPIIIEGYVIPLFWKDDRVSEFLLMRDNFECCMGGPPTPGHWLYAQAEGGASLR